METQNLCVHSINSRICNSCQFIIDQSNLAKNNLTGREALVFGYKLKIEREKLEKLRKKVDADFWAKRQLEKMPRDNPINIAPKRLKF